MRHRISLIAFAVVIALSAQTVGISQSRPAFDEAFLNGFTWRNMPPVPVTDLVIHPREADLVVATFGRGLFITHIAPLREIDSRTLDAPLHFFEVRPRAVRSDEAWGNYELSGDRQTFTPNEPNGLVFEYRLALKADGNAKVTVADTSGAIVVTLEGTAHAGMNRAVWDGRDAKGQSLPPGPYTITIDAGGAKGVRTAQLLRRP